MQLEERLAQLRGHTVDLQLEISRHLTGAELKAFGDGIVDKGMVVAFVEMRSKPWPHTLRVVFDNDLGIGLFWLPIMALLPVLGMVGITGYGVWRANQFMNSITDTITRNLVPLTMVLAGTVILGTYALRR